MDLNIYLVIALVISVAFNIGLTVTVVSQRNQIRNSTVSAKGDVVVGDMKKKSM